MKKRPGRDSPFDAQHPLSNADAGSLIKGIVRLGAFSVGRHALEEMANDDLMTVDVVSTLRGGWVEGYDFIDGTYRYRVCTRNVFVVVAFRSEHEISVVTAWRCK